MCVCVCVCIYTGVSSFLGMARTRCSSPARRSDSQSASCGRVPLVSRLKATEPASSKGSWARR